jgi:hypothetical protein
VNCYLNERFNDQIERKRVESYTITPLVCMSASTLERSVCSLKKMALSKVLEQRIKADAKLELPFEAAAHMYLRDRFDVGMLTWMFCQS